ncbi:MAG TPA: hypothetical protein VFQ73_08075 [Flavisolibacter sp.]|nr:hypothetical protein [Flavisolibacter sp.]
MIAARLLHIIVLILLVPILWIHGSGCAKEYSFEGADTTASQDTLIIVPTEPPFSICEECDSTATITDWKWHFKSTNNFLCGEVDTAIINPERTVFTFFGPSACSDDTGIVMSVFFDPVKFDRDHYNITTNRVAFYYYDNVGATHIFINDQAINFSVTIGNYIHQTRTAIGTFSGQVLKTNGELTTVHSGKFMIRLE